MHSENKKTGGDLSQMSKFFIDDSNIQESKIRIVGEDVSHIKRVLRSNVGDSLILCDGKSTDYNCIIEKIDTDVIEAKILNSYNSESEPVIDVTLFQGIPKSDKMDLIIQKSVELGVKSIVPVITERTVVKIENQKDADKKVTRWQKIAYEAAKQSNRGTVPKIEQPISFKEALEVMKDFQLKIIPYEKEERISLKSIINDNIIDITSNNINKISVIIGPEGGFTEEEIDAATANGVFRVTLGPRILRTETAGINVLSILMYELGDPKR